MEKMSKTTKTKVFVKKHMVKNDGCHDFDHVIRVHKLANQISTCENIQNIDQLCVIDYSCLLHDLEDNKYTKKGCIVEPFMRSLNIRDNIIKRVLFVIRNLSYVKQQSNPVRMNIELAIVMDATRLDAIGSIGISRCFYQIGIKKGKLDDSFEHFNKELLNYKASMNTSTGKKIAIQRHAFMITFCIQYELEMDCIICKKIKKK